MRNNTIRLERLSNGFVLRFDRTTQGLYNPDGTKRHGDGPFLIDMVGGAAR